MVEVVLVVILVIMLLWVFTPKEKFRSRRSNSGPDRGVARGRHMSAATGGVNYVRLFEDFALSDLLYEFTNSTSTMKYLKYAVKAQVKSIEVNLPNDLVDSTAAETVVELWNVREGKGLESSQSDFYENTIYTTPDYLRQVTGNLTKIAEVKAGEKLMISELPPIKKILIVARI